MPETKGLSLEEIEDFFLRLADVDGQGKAVALDEKSEKVRLEPLL